MSLSKKYCDNLILRTLFQDQIYSKDIKTSTPTPCQDDGKDTGRVPLDYKHGPHHSRTQIYLTSILMTSFRENTKPS